MRGEDATKKAPINQSSERPMGARKRRKRVILK
jgi:hypothetical protein